MSTHAEIVNRLVQRIRTHTDVPEHLRKRAEFVLRQATICGQQVPFEKMGLELMRQASTKADYVVDCRNLDMGVETAENIEGEAPEVPVLRFPVGAVRPSFVPTEACHEQIAEKCKIPLPYYARVKSANATLLAQNVNQWIKDREKRQIRTLDGKARALVSDKYRAIDHSDIFFAGIKLFQERGAAVVQADLSDRHMYVKAINPDLEVDAGKGIGPLWGGVVLRNSETGHGSLDVSSFYFRIVCLNGMMGDSLFNRVHLGVELEVGVYSQETISQTSKAIWMQARDQIGRALDQTNIEEYAAKLQGAQLVLLPSPTELVAGGWNGIGVSEVEKKAILKELMTSSNDIGWSQFALSQAVTAIAREHLEGDRKAELEHMGFKLATMEQEPFERLMIQATVPARRRVVV
jgi:hypothetical protein